MIGTGSVATPSAERKKLAGGGHEKKPRMGQWVVRICSRLKAHMLEIDAMENSVLQQNMLKHGDLGKKVKNNVGIARIGLMSNPNLAFAEICVLVSNFLMANVRPAIVRKGHALLEDTKYSKSA